MSKTIAILFLSLFVSAANAALVWGTDASSALTGMRTSAEFPSSGGVIGTNAWAEGGFSISWNITDNANGTWTYAYTVDTSTDGQIKSISHLLLEVTDATPFNIIQYSSDEGNDLEGPKDWTTTGPGSAGNPGLPNDLFGVKFDDGADDSGIITYTLVTDRAPVWGVFYAKGGQEIAYSNALNFADYKTITTLTEYDYIVRPDGLTVIPIPPAMWLLGSGLIGLIGIRRKA